MSTSKTRNRKGLSKTLKEEQQISRDCMGVISARTVAFEEKDQQKNKCEYEEGLSGTFDRVLCVCSI